MNAPVESVGNSYGRIEAPPSTSGIDTSKRKPDKKSKVGRTDDTGAPSQQEKGSAKESQSQGSSRDQKTDIPKRLLAKDTSKVTAKVEPVKGAGEPNALRSDSKKVF